MKRAVALVLIANSWAADGSIHIACSEGTEDLLKKFNKLFVGTHPGVKFAPPITGPTSLAFYSLITGTSALALLDREIWPLEARPFRQIYNYEPIGIRIGRVGYSGAGHMNPPGIYVNSRNPLRGLTLNQVARIFTSGGVGGDIRRWEQVGLEGEWRERVIHIYGPRDDGGMASAFRHAMLGGFPFARQYETLSGPAQILQAVADDPYGIGFADAYHAGRFAATVRMLYASPPYLIVYVIRELDSFTKEYVQLMLSREGQSVKDGGYVPLAPSEAAREVSKLK